MPAHIENRDALIAGAPPALRARRALALDLLDAALDAVEPRRVTVAAIERARAVGLALDGCTLFAFGKAARAMAEGALAACRVRRGIVVGFEEGALGPLALRRGAHPLPARDAPRVGAEVLALARSLGPGDVALCLVGGGGSAMLELPRPGVTMAEIAAVTARLNAGGAPIEELNRARAALSQLKGGGLARAMNGATIVNVVLSDVPGGALDVVASGPTLAPGTHDFVAADNTTARRAMVELARARGLRIDDTPGFLRGEARDVGPRWLRESAALADLDGRVHGGETVVTVRGHGRGGRNQELALATLVAGTIGLFAALGTDGVDGASDAAGALVDPAVAATLAAEGLDARASLADNDSDALFRAVKTQLITGRTGTNVADVCLFLR